MAKRKSAEAQGAAALEGSVSHLLHRAVQVALDVYAEELGPGAITQRQYAVLAAVAEREGATQAELVRATGIDRSTLADMAARMMRRGLLERERSASDGRANAVRLTEAGRAVLADAAPKVAEADERIVRRISGRGRRREFLALLSGLVQRPSEKAGKKRAKAKAAAAEADATVVPLRKKRPKRAA